MKKPEIVLAGTGDLPRMLEIENCCFSNPWSPGYFTSAITSPGLDIYKCLTGGTTAGYIVLYRIRETMIIANLAVAPEFRRRGIGKTLLEYGMNDGRQKQCSFSILDVRQSNNAAIKLYTKAGYIIIGSNRGYYQNPVEDSHIMGRPI